MLRPCRLPSELPGPSARCSCATSPFQLPAARTRAPCRRALRLRAQTGNSSNGEQDGKVSGSGKDSSKEKTSLARSQKIRKGRSRNKEEQDASLNAEDFNPIALGRRSR